MKKKQIEIKKKTKKINTYNYQENIIENNIINSNELVDNKYYLFNIIRN